MTLLRPIAIDLLTLICSTSAAPSVARGFNADIYLPGCKDFIAGSIAFFADRCVRVAEVLNPLNSEAKLFCAPEGTTRCNLCTNGRLSGARRETNP